MKIAILVAMQKELSQLRGLLCEELIEHHGTRNYYLGHIGQHEIVLQQCGIGKVNAAVGVTELLIRYTPDLVVSSGVAGGCGEGVRMMDVVVSSACRYHDVYCGPEGPFGQIAGMPETFVSPDSLVEKACVLDAGPCIHAGVIATGDWFVDTREKMQDIFAHFPEVLAVDMESAAIAHACHIAQVPFLSFRIISDNPLSDEKGEQYNDFWDKMAEGSFDVIRHFISSL